MRRMIAALCMAALSAAGTAYVFAQGEDRQHLVLGRDVDRSVPMR